MISRRQIIKSQQQESSGCSTTNGDNEAASEKPYSRKMSQNGVGDKQPGARKITSARSQQQAKLISQEEQDYEAEAMNAINGHTGGFPNGQPDYRHFDPYSVYGDEDEEEDVWYSEERLFEDHMQEIINKWMAIDDEIWAKIICMERNRRIAKAYARKHSLTINGSRDEYLDGTTLGLNSFDNPDRDAKTRHIKQYIGHGLRIKITQEGDIVARRMSKSNIFLHLSQALSYNSRSREPNYGMINGEKETTNPLFSPIGYKGADSSETGASNKTPASSSERTWPSSSQSGSNGDNKMASKSQLQSRALEFNKSVRIFDMERFKALVESETKQPCPDRKFLQNQCISVISFVLNDSKMLNLPSWIMVINIVAIELLKSKLGFMTGLDLLEMPGHFEIGDEDEPSDDLDDTADDIEVQSSSGVVDIARLRNTRARPIASRYTAQRAEWPPVTQDPCSVGSSEKPGVSGEDVAESSGDGALSGDQQQTTAPSSSSGFNSHCSSQNNSSANSSSSSAATDEQQKQQAGLPEKDPKQTQVVDEFKKKVASAGARYKQQLESGKPFIQESRGKRPPKLPHRLLGARRKSPTNEGAVTSANLILVAPTGFSPPTPKRKGSPIVEKMLLQNGDMNPLHLSSIKLIDENGHCRIIKQDPTVDSGLLRRAHIPLVPGIPAHAQLAPPATQRKILNYLMSATNHNNTNAANTLTTDSDTSIYAPPMERHPRPLPMLPSHQKKLLGPKQQPQHTMYDENLYYCGLQARVPVRHHQHHNISKPIDLRPPPNGSMLNGYKHPGTHMYQHHHQLHNLRQQRSLNNLNGASGYQLYQTSHPTIFQNCPKKPTSRPLLKLFKVSNRENPTPTPLNKETKAMFLSVDNISDNRPQKSSSIFDFVHLPMKIRSSKNKLKT